MFSLLLGSLVSFQLCKNMHKSQILHLLILLNPLHRFGCSGPQPWSFTLLSSLASCLEVLVLVSSASVNFLLDRKCSNNGCIECRMEGAMEKWMDGWMIKRSSSDDQTKRVFQAGHIVMSLLSTSERSR